MSVAPLRVAALRATAFRAGRGLRWYLRQATGEAKWDTYLQSATGQGLEPMSRRDFERHRSAHEETRPKARCC